jgi:hypothetical protein
MSATRRIAPEYQHPRIVYPERFFVENAGASELRRLAEISSHALPRLRIEISSLFLSPTTPFPVRLS